MSTLNNLKNLLSIMTKHTPSTNLVIEVTTAIRQLIIHYRISGVSDHIKILKCSKVMVIRVKKVNWIGYALRAHEIMTGNFCKLTAYQSSNCMNYNKNQKKNLPTDHTAYDEECDIVKNLQCHSHWRVLIPSCW